MAREKTKWTNADSGGKSKTDIFPGQNDAGETECDGIDAEIKSIFDDLRTVGSPQSYSLGEVLAKAIAAEKARTGGKATASHGKISGGRLNESIKTYLRQMRQIWRIKSQQLQLQSVIALLLLSLGVVFIIAKSSSLARANSELVQINDEEPVQSNSKYNLIGQK
jgi:hypothetical protein